MVTGALAFTIQVDASGNVTLTQMRSVKEGSGEVGDVSEGASFASNLVTLTATITDKDNDTATASVDLGKQLSFKDDGPTISATGAGPTLFVDESFLTSGTNGINGTTPDVNQTHVSGAYAGAFTSVQGADSATTAYTLSFSTSASGLVDSQTNSGDVLVMNGSNVVEGHVGTATGALAFTIQVDASGNVTLTQMRSVKEGSGEVGDVSEGASFASNLVTLTATITDKDNDTATASVDLGKQLSFKDDGPTISATGAGPTLFVDESFLTSGTNGINGTTPDVNQTHVSGAYAGAFTSVQGADSATTAYTLSFSTSASGLVDS